MSRFDSVLLRVLRVSAVGSEAHRGNAESAEWTRMEREA